MQGKWIPGESKTKQYINIRKQCKKEHCHKLQFVKIKMQSCNDRQNKMAKRSQNYPLAATSAISHSLMAVLLFFLPSSFRARSTKPLAPISSSAFSMTSTLCPRSFSKFFSISIANLFLFTKSGSKLFKSSETLFKSLSQQTTKPPYPFATPSGSSLATILDSPASCTLETTAETSL